MCVFLVCVLVLFRASVCAFRVSELLVVRLSFVVKLFLLLWSFRSEFAFSCRVSNSSFRIVFWSRFSNSRSRILKSNFEFDFFVSLLYSISRISIFDSSFEFKFLEFSCRICRRNFRFVALFDFSNFNFRCLVLFDFSNVVEPFDFSKFDFSIQVPWISNSSFSSSWSIRLLEFRCSIWLLEFRFVSRILSLSSSLNSSIFVLVDSKFSFSCLVPKSRFESW